MLHPPRLTTASLKLTFEVDRDAQWATVTDTVKGTAMGNGIKHSKVEIAAKLAQANDLATQGKLQSEIAQTLGVSVMTLHRWRKTLPAVPKYANGSSQSDQAPQTRLAELQLENSRLRRLVTDLLLEKIKLEEALAGRRPRPRWRSGVAVRA